jgi:hypothetical protein
MMVYGQFNVFPRDRGVEILKRARAALAPGGSLLLEIQGFEGIERRAGAGPSWYTAASGLFSSEPHLVLQENFWNSDSKTSTNRFQVIDARTGSVTSYALSNEAYSKDELAEGLRSAGFADVEWYPALTGQAADEEDMPVVVARG